MPIVTKVFKGDKGYLNNLFLYKIRVNLLTLIRSLPAYLIKNLFTSLFFVKNLCGPISNKLFPSLTVLANPPTTLVFSIIIFLFYVCLILWQQLNLQDPNQLLKLFSYLFL